MFKVENERIELVLSKNGKEVKKITFRNTLTDQYLDMVLYYMLPQSIADALFPDLIIDVSTSSPFGIGAFDFSTPKQILNTSSTTATYTEINNRDGLGKVVYFNKGKEIISTYNIDTFNNEELLKYILFFSKKGTEYRLTSFIDVSSFGIYGGQDYQLTFNRFDKITSNEVSIQDLSVSYDYLPPLEYNSFTKRTINKITLCYGGGGSGYQDEYLMSELSFSKLSAGVVEITGFNNFYIGAYDYPQEDYPQDDYSQEQGKVKSVKFTYSNATETYVNIEDLDLTYNNKEIKIRLKCERGSY